MKPLDFVLVLDRISWGSDMTLAEVTSIDSENKNVLIRTLQRGAKLESRFREREPAKFTRLVRSPQSLVFIFRPDHNDDMLEYFNDPTLLVDPQIWSHVEEDMDQNSSGEDST